MCILNCWLAFSNSFASCGLCPDFGLCFKWLCLLGILLFWPVSPYFPGVNPVCQCYEGHTLECSFSDFQEMSRDELQGGESPQHHQTFDRPPKMNWFHSSGNSSVRDSPLNPQNIATLGRGSLSRSFSIILGVWRHRRWRTEDAQRQGNWSSCTFVNFFTAQMLLPGLPQWMLQAIAMRWAKITPKQ